MKTEDKHNRIEKEIEKVRKKIISSNTFFTQKKFPELEKRRLELKSKDPMGQYHQMLQNLSDIVMANRGLTQEKAEDLEASKQMKRLKALDMVRTISKEIDLDDLNYEEALKSYEDTIGGEEKGDK